MGRKDAAANFLPVDNYRKQIGGQHKKQTSADVKNLKKHTEQKSSTPKLYQDIKFSIGCLVVSILAVYLALYYWLLGPSLRMICINWCFVAASTTILSTGCALWATYKWLTTLDLLWKATDGKYEQLNHTYRQMVAHYGTVEHLKHLKGIVPAQAIGYHQKLAEFCHKMCVERKIPCNQILDIGCSVGGTSFQLTKCFHTVIATDTSFTAIALAQQLQQFSEYNFPFSNEGGAHVTLMKVTVPIGCNRDRLTFWHEDACNMNPPKPTFNCVVISNTLTCLSQPKSFLCNVANFIHPGGLLIIADAYDWPVGPEEPLGNVGNKLTLDAITEILSPNWTYEEEVELPFFVARNCRLAEIGDAHVTVWKCRMNI